MTFLSSSAAGFLGAVVTVSAFQAPQFHLRQQPFTSHSIRSSFDSRGKVSLKARKTLTEERSFDPLDLASSESPLQEELQLQEYLSKAGVVGATTATGLAVLSSASEQAMAASDALLKSAVMNPAEFQPVCPASDGLYRFLQTSTVGVIGRENFVEYGPLIAGGLLRVRLELCVVESFFNEAVGPFIAENGLNWILPLHETVETFLAGSIFAFATTFILIGSTKIVSVVITYTDFLLGLPSRILGGFFFDRASGKKVTLDVGFGPLKTRLIGPSDEDAEGGVNFGTAPLSAKVILALSAVVKYFGVVLGFIRAAIEAIDLFVGRYLVVWATGYILLKFVHFKIFPEFP